jgi:hypothetical protein
MIHPEATPRLRAAHLRAALALLLAVGAIRADASATPQAQPDRKVEPGTKVEPGARAERPAQADPAAVEQRAKELAALLERWRANETAMGEDYKAWRAATQEARTKGLPREQWPGTPLAAWFPRNEELADLGQPDALVWCLQQVSTTGRDLATILACKDRWYAKLVEEHVDSAALEKALVYLRAEGSPGGLPAARAMELLETVARTTKKPAVQAKALSAVLEPLSRSGLADAPARRKALLERLVKEHGDTPEGLRAKAALNGEVNLAIGNVAPDFTTKDADGVEFKLSDYRGKVVVLDFWGFW